MKFKRILLITLLLAILTIGAVSATQHNSTDEILSVEQNDEISIIENNTEVISVNENNTEILSEENNNTVISVSANDNEVLSEENNTTVISVSANDSEVLSAENHNTIISVSNDEDLTSYSPFAIEPQMTEHKTQYKTLYVGQAKFLKKYKNMINGYKIPSKKNKKAWKKHIAFVKASIKQYKKVMKTSKKVIKKAAANHWHAYGNSYYKIKYSGKYVYLKFYWDCYRTYNYNPLLNKGWWD